MTTLRVALALAIAGVALALTTPPTDASTPIDAIRSITLSANNDYPRRQRDRPMGR